jgi:histidinol-phosphate aminotransferase
MNPIDLLRPEVRSLKPYTIEHTAAPVKLDANESPYDPPAEIAQEIREALGRIHLNRYPDPAATRLKEQLAEMTGVAPDQILLGNGSDELIGYLITTFTGQGKGVCFPSPTFSMYGIIAAALGQRTIPVSLTESFGLDPERLLDVARREKPQILLVASPNNPTGSVFAREQVVRILDAYDGITVLDEAYIDFSQETGFLKELSRYPGLVVLRTLSKIGMAALRVGFLIGRADVIAQLEKVRLPYNVNAYSQVAAQVMLEHEAVLREQIATIVSERRRLAAALSRTAGLQLFPSEANFLLFRTDRPGALFERLLRDGILVRNLDQPGLLAGCLRVTVGKPEENDAFLTSLKRVFEGGG